MASELALAACKDLPGNSEVLDPMAGSGTVLRVAAESGCRAVGFDTDPLAVILSRVWNYPVNVDEFRTLAKDALHTAKSLDGVHLPWIDDDDETRAFINFWFVEPQRSQLRKLAYVLTKVDGHLSDCVRVAISRLIIVKKRGASIGGDIAHSRPHRIRETNDFDVFEEFGRSVEWLARRLLDEPPPGNVLVAHADARAVPLEDSSVDAIVTSPPYLNAIDYLRGHRMSLVWFGHQLRGLRAIRSGNVGTERAPEDGSRQLLAGAITQSLSEIALLPRRKQKMIERYALDIHDVMREAARVLKAGGRSVWVVGNSCHQGIFVENTKVVLKAADVVGLTLVDESDREIPPSHRYLPPPSRLDEGELAGRMRTESVLVLAKP